MKKFVLLGVLCILSAFTTVNAQTYPKVRYSGDINVSWMVSTNGLDIMQNNIRTTHGIIINETFFFGMGIGLDRFCPDYKEQNKINEEIILYYGIPLYANIKGFLPVSPKTKLFLSLDLGESFGLDDNENNFIFMTPMIGTSFKVGKKTNAINLSLGYNYSSIILKDNKIDGKYNPASNLAGTSGSMVFRFAFQF